MSDKLTPEELEAVDEMIRQFEEQGIQAGENLVTLTAATPATVELTAMVIVTVAGSCLVEGGEVRLTNLRKSADDLKTGVTLSQLKDARAKLTA